MKPKAKRHLTSVQLRPNIEKMLERFTRHGVSKSELINEALRVYLVEREFKETRAQLIPYAQSKGVYTDEDVLRALS